MEADNKMRLVSWMAKAADSVQWSRLFFQIINECATLLLLRYFYSCSVLNRRILLLFCVLFSCLVVRFRSRMFVKIRIDRLCFPLRLEPNCSLIITMRNRETPAVMHRRIIARRHALKLANSARCCNTSGRPIHCCT